MLRGIPACPTETIGNPSSRVIPFDYVAKFALTGRAGNRLEDEVPVNVEGGFVATAIGYGLVPAERGVDLEEAVKAEPQLTTATAPNTPIVDTTAGTVDIWRLPLSIFPPTALIDGLRLASDLQRFAGAFSGSLDKFPLRLLDHAFERLNRLNDVAFRYEVLDTARGHDLQNRPLFNVAGLGIANGDRPFKRLARPMLFLPRSTIRVTVEEGFGRGQLFMVFQGYKILGIAGGAR
jgi:hypothetical protein